MCLFQAKTTFCFNYYLISRVERHHSRLIYLISFFRLYESGLNPKIDILYPKIEYPVSTGTPFLSQYVGWEHSEDW